MDGHRSPFHAAISLGSWFGVRVQLSLWFPIVGLILCWKFDLQLGLLLTLLIFLSVLVHEFAHIFAARATGGSANEILMWPAGGLAMTRPANTFHSEFLTSAAGPLSNLVICLLTYPAISAAGYPPGIFHPFELVHVELTDAFWHDCAILLFDLNFLLFLVNLLPVYPLDGGQMLLSVLSLRIDAETAKFASLRIGMAVGLIAAVFGLMFEQVWLVFLGFLVFCMGMHEFFMLQLSEQLDDSFLGYDFSQGYTSLERSQGRERERRPGMIGRWRQRRAEEKRQREAAEKVATEQKLDELLDKVHREGISSLTDAERRFLQQASTRYRSQDGPT